MDLTAFYSQFRDETAENIRILNAGLLVLESLEPGAEEGREHIDTIFRAMHTIKGSARLLGFDQVGRVAHTCEYILGAVREGRRALIARWPTTCCVVATRFWSWSMPRWMVALLASMSRR